MESSQRLDHLRAHPQFKAALEVLATLRKKGFKAYLAGGCVRDGLVKRLAKDLDIATSATPLEIEDLFSKTVPTGRDFGVIVVVTPAGPLEVVTFRKDENYLDGRRPEKVVFSGDKEDALRRDFTINALFYDPFSEKVYDYVGGLSDLRARRIRTVGKPHERFREDKLRMLRAVRFHAQLGYEVEQETLLAISEMASEIRVVSWERVFQEMTRLLNSINWVGGLRLLKETGLAKYIWSELDFGSLNVEQLRLVRPANPIQWEYMFAAISWLLNSRGSCEARLVQWKAPKQSILRVKKILDSAESLLRPGVGRVERAKILAHAEVAEILSLVRLDLERRHESTRMIEAWINDFLEMTHHTGLLPSPYLKGEDLLKIGFQPGEKLGQALQLLYDEQLLGKINSKPEGLQRAKDFLLA